MEDNDYKIELLIGCVFAPLMMLLLIPLGLVSVVYAVFRYIYKEIISKIWRTKKRKKV